MSKLSRRQKSRGATLQKLVIESLSTKDEDLDTFIDKLTPNQAKVINKLYVEMKEFNEKTKIDSNKE